MKPAAGQWVRHNTLDWGPGRVESVADYVMVRFPDHQDGKALRFKPDTCPLTLDPQQSQQAASAKLAALMAPPPKAPSRVASKTGVPKVAGAAKAPSSAKPKAAKKAVKAAPAQIKAAELLDI